MKVNSYPKFRPGDKVVIEYHGNYIITTVKYLMQSKETKTWFYYLDGLSSSNSVSEEDIFHLEDCDY